MISSYLRGADGVIIVYDITDKKSFLNVDDWFEEIKEYCDMDDISVVLVGNKVDLEGERQVTYEEGKEMADKYGVKFFETSVKTGQNVNELFQCLIDDIVEKKQDEEIIELPDLIPNKKGFWAKLFGK